MRLTLALGLALLLAAPAAADPIAAYNVTTFWHGESNGNTVLVNFEQDDQIGSSLHQFTIDALPVGQVSRKTDLDLSTLQPDLSTGLQFFLFGLGYPDGGFHGAASTIPLTASQLQTGTVAELEFSRRDLTPFYNDEGEVLFQRVDVAFELRFYHTPEPSSALLLAVGLCFCHRRSLRR